MDFNKTVVWSILLLVAGVCLLIIARRLRSSCSTIEKFKSHRHRSHHHSKHDSSSSDDDEDPKPYRHDVLYGYKVSLPAPGSIGGNTQMPEQLPPTPGTLPPAPQVILTSAPKDLPVATPATTIPMDTTIPTVTGTPNTMTLTGTPNTMTPTVTPTGTPNAPPKSLATISSWLSGVYNFWANAGIQTDGSMPALHDGTGALATTTTAPSLDGYGEQTLIQQSRHLWFFSSYYVHASKPAALAIAEKLKTLILSKKSGTGSIPYSLSKSPPDQRVHLYSQFFALYGLAAYIIAIKNDTTKATELVTVQGAALEVFAAVQTKFLYPKANPTCYMDALAIANPEGEPNTETDPTAKVSLNGVMHGIEALTELYIATADPTVKKSLQMLMDLLVDKMYVTAEFRILDTYNPTIATQVNAHIDYGHNIEMVFLMDLAVKALQLTDTQRTKYMQPMKQICKSMLKDKTAWDTILNTVKDNTVAANTTKSWWTQFEVMTACEWMYADTGEAIYRTMIDDIMAFVTTKFLVTPPPGTDKIEFYSTISLDSSWTADQVYKGKLIGSNWKSSYHVGRSLMFLEKWMKSNTSPVVAAPADVVNTAPANCTAPSYTLIASTNKAEYDNKIKFSGNKRIDIKPSNFVVPTTAAELATIIKCANQSNIKWRVRCGGHSYEGFSLIAGGYVIDLEKLIGVSIKTGNVEVGAGELFGNVYMKLAAQNVYVHAGTGPNVGVSGLTLGGGVGWATRLNGPTCNSVIGAEVVTAAGDIKVLNAGKVEGADLLEALRGGGPFYAVVTKWIFKTYPVPDKVHVSKTTWGIDTTPVTQDTAKALLSKFVEGQPWLEAANYTMIEFFHGFGKIDVVIHSHAPTFVAPTFLTEMIKTQTPNSNNAISYDKTKWTDYILNITNLKNTSGWSAASLEDTALRELTREDKTVFTASSLIFDSTHLLSDTHVNALVAAVIVGKKDASFYQIRAFGASSSALVDNMPSSWPHKAATMECQIYGIDAGSDTWVQQLMTLGSAGHYYNYTYKGITKFEDYFPDTSISVNLLKVKKTYDPTNLIMSGTDGAPPLA